MCSSRTLYKFPLISKQQIKITIIPLSWICCPRTLNSTCYAISSLTCSMGTFPSKTHLLNRSTFRFNPNKILRSCSMCFTKSMTTCSKCYCFLIIHRHPTKSFTYIFSASKRIWITIWSLRIYINQAHLDCT